jgi:uncharacterized protein (DUF111 family)
VGRPHHPRPGGHRRGVDQVHAQHLERGARPDDVDDGVDAADLMEVDLRRVAASPVATGTGMVRSAHGVLPNPAPAVVELLRGAPTYGREVTVELTTPTGAALLAALAEEYGPLPAMAIEATGFGAGSRELDGLPNATQVVVGNALAGSQPRPGQPVVELSANLDDATGEILAHAVTALLEAGAHDAWVVPVVMKKGRPGHVVHALADPALAEQVARVLAAETGTLGVRGHVLERWPDARTVESVEVDGLPVRVKVSPGRVKAEHDDVVRVARRTGRTVREVAFRAEAAYHDTDDAG